MYMILYHVTNCVLWVLTAVYAWRGYGKGSAYSNAQYWALEYADPLPYPWTDHESCSGTCKLSLNHLQTVVTLWQILNLSFSVYLVQGAGDEAAVSKRIWLARKKVYFFAVFSNEFADDLSPLSKVVDIEYGMGVDACWLVWHCGSIAL